MLANGLWVLLTITDIFLIGRLCDNPELLADYKVAGIFPSNMAIVTAAIGMFLGPYFVSHETDYIWVKKNYLRALAGNAALVGMISVVLFLGASWIIRIVYGEDYTDAVGIMRILTVAFFISSSFKSLTANFLAIMGRVRQTLITSAIGFIIQVAMGIIVIPHFGIRGLAYGNIVTNSIMSIVLIIIFAREFEDTGGKEA